jgi:hypothetical protein
MGDEHHRHAALALQVLEQREDLRLHGDVERAGRLVRDQQARLTAQGERDHHALTHTAGELVRTLSEATRRIGELHAREQRQRARACFAAVNGVMPSQHLHQLRADRQVRRE